MLTSIVKFLIHFTKLNFILKLLREETLKILFIDLLSFLVWLESKQYYISELTELIDFYYLYPMSCYKEIYL